MSKYFLLYFGLMLTFSVHPSVLGQNNASDIVGTWLSEPGTSKIRIYACGDGKQYCGKIVWLKRDKEKDGTPRVDKNNPDPNKRKNHLQNMVILKFFVFDSEKKEWNKGTIYDPYTGFEYKCFIKRSGNTLSVRGYVGTSLLGRTEKWTLVAN